MRNAFDIVRGAVSTKDLVPVLTHFAFNAGRVYGANGRVQISAPVPELKHLSLTVPATPLIAAMDGCEEEEPTIVADGTDLIVKSSGFRAKIPAKPFDEFPLQPCALDGSYTRLRRGLVENTLTRLCQVIGEDASRPWCNTICFDGTTAYATNNVALAAADTVECGGVRFALPVFAVDELLRIGDEPEGCVIDDQGAEFLLPGDVTFRAQLFAHEWPDAGAIIDAAGQGAKFKAIRTEALMRAIQLVKPFCEDQKLPRIRLQGKSVSAVGSVMTAEDARAGTFGSAAMDFHADMLLQILPLVHATDWSKFPRVPFKGDGIRGVFLGLRT